MDDSSLRDYRSDVSQLPENEDTDADIHQASMYHQEINTLKIEKLSQRITIITIILPCIIIAVLAFAYIDMKERVVDVDETKGTQVAKMAQKLEEKMNALDVRIAKAKFQLDEKLPQVDKRSQSLENQLAKISAAKADLKALNTAVAGLEKQIKANAGRDKATLASMQKSNKELLGAIKQNSAGFKSQADQLKEEMQLFKEEFDARLLELSAYEQQIAALNKSTSLLDKQLKTLKKDSELARSRSFEQMRLSLEQMIQELDAKIQKQKPAASSSSGQGAAVTPAVPPKTAEQPSKPVPQLDTGNAPSISEETLTQ
ncbi:MAG: hypothetical protein MI863_02155 [Desulfobacterales bacterium]|nr:hypothetical protein [Desulfobacterales bacterium]